MLLKIESWQPHSSYTYIDKVDKIYYHEVLHEADCDCPTCTLARNFWTNLPKNQRYYCGCLGILTNDHSPMNDIFLMPGDKVYLLNEQGKTIDKIIVTYDD